MIRTSIIVLTLITSSVHLYLGISSGTVIFILNGLGFLGFLVLLFAPISFVIPFRKMIVWIFIAYTLTTIGMYFRDHSLVLPALAHGEEEVLVEPEVVDSQGRSVRQAVITPSTPKPPVVDTLGLSTKGVEILLVLSLLAYLRTFSPPEPES